MLFPNYVAAKQAGLLLNKLRGHNKRPYCSSKLGVKTSSLIVTQKRSRNSKTHQNNTVKKKAIHI
jgi:hypothetical protein